MPNGARNLAFEVLVVGAGPAGITAACAAVESRARTAVVDANPSPGGQIWRANSVNHESSPRLSNRASTKWRARLLASDATLISGAEIIAAPEPNLLVAESLTGAMALRYKKLIVATGARERFLPFPGWTLPGVMGAGGLQALVKSGLPISGARVVVAGTGPLLLAVAAHLRADGARIESICEQTSQKHINSFASKLTSHPGKFFQALQLRALLAGIPYCTGTWPVRVGGDEKIEWVEVSNGSEIRRIECDYLACGFDLVPNTELAQLLGCRLTNGAVAVNESMQTSVENVFCAGEPLGIGGLETSLIEGQIAGHSAGGDAQRAKALFPARKKAREFAHLLAGTFALRAELRDLAEGNTFVCRCEDVTYSKLQAYANWRDAKLQTRCGMGPCQGRVCGPATQFLFGWQPDSVRPPIFPARIDSLIGVSEYSESHLTV
jgi:NADPH-dependent 2,4-dienoyl-CoA reductase/sulfur reductase-like enzyme